MKSRNIIFIILVFLILFVCELGFVRVEKNISFAENRTLQKFEHFTFISYLDGTYQKKLESALSDQFIGGETIKQELKSILNFTDYSNIPERLCKNKNLNLDGSFFTYNCNHDLIVKYDELTKEARANINSRLEVYSKLNDYIDTYYYFLSTPSIFDFEKNEYHINIIDYIKKNLKGNYNFASLEFKNYEEYRKLFYKTDHHWNYYGSYMAYTQIAEMFDDAQNIIKPVETVTFDDIVFYGSRSRISQIFDYKEPFTVYKFNFPEFTVINDKLYDTYGNEENYFKGKYSKSKLANHYGEFYGEDSGEVIFDFNDNDKENLLVLGSSYTNAINKLIASHFNKTYVIDLRHYEEVMGEKFDIKRYIEENNIDKVLIIADYSFLINESFNIDWSK